jgi:glycosyltransferase involved in cell wall biosynthesis
MLPVSCFIIAQNEAKRIVPAIRSVRDWVDEIVVVDSGSTDGTDALARAEGARVIHHDWAGFGQQKRFAEEQCRNDWLFNLDADEVVTPELATEIRALFRGSEGPSAAAFGMPVNLVYPGRARPRLLARDHYCLRLYDVTRVRFRNSTLHDSVDPGNEPVGHLRGSIHHYSFSSLAELAKKYDARSRYFALHAKTKPLLLLGARMIIELPTAFLKYYAGRRHFTGGWIGVRVAGIIAYYRWLRVVRMYRYQRSQLSATTALEDVARIDAPAISRMEASQGRTELRDASDVETSRERRVVVCICTRGRPRLFARCLTSVLAQALARTDYRLSVVVVDNSPEGEERDGVEALAIQNVAYAHEPRTGIPFARNAAIEVALKLAPTWIAFIDHDEVAPQGWLARLLETADYNRADVVYGGLISASAAEIDHLAASWRPRHVIAKTRRTKMAATNNVLFRAWIVADPMGLRFDENMRETGGSDGEFFMRVADTGAVIVRTSDALVFEERSEEREGLSWLRKRAFRVGANCNYRYRKNRKPGIVAMTLILGRATESAARAFCRALLSLLLIPVSTSRAAGLARKGILDVSFAWGCLAPYFGIEPKAYH